MMNAAFNKAPVGNGPFKFVEYRANDRWIFEANPDYPAALGGRPYLDRIVWRPVPDAVAQVTEISTGGADMAVTPPSDQYNTLSQQPGLKGLVRGGRQFANLIWNGKIAPLNDARVRRALTMAIDRQQIINTLRGGHGTLATGPIGPFHWAYDTTIKALPFNPDSARALLKVAGIEDRNGDGTVDLQNGKPFEIEIKLPAGSLINRDMAELIRSNLSEVGVKVTTRPTDMSTMMQDFTSTRRNFQAILLGWESDYRINLYDMFHSKAMSGQFQMASYSNPRLDSLIDRVMVVKSREEAKPIYSQMQRILRDDQPWTFLYYYPDLVLMRDRVQGADMDTRGALVNVQKWWVTDPSVPAATPRNDSAGRAPSPDSAPPR
jgi:peptide/nickel transport system substrate-binding protein